MAKPCCACSRSSSDEIFQLREDNAALQCENVMLRDELQTLRQQLWTQALTYPRATEYPVAEHPDYGLWTSQPSSLQNTSRKERRKQMMRRQWALKKALKKPAGDCHLDQGISSIPTAEDSQQSSLQKIRRSRQRRPPSTLTNEAIEAIERGPFYKTAIESVEKAAERFVSEFLESSAEYDIERAVLLHTTFPDKTQQLLIRAHFAKKFFPPGMTQRDYNEQFRHKKVDLRSAAASICDPGNVNDVVSVFINAFHKRSPKCLAEEAARRQSTSS